LARLPPSKLDKSLLSSASHSLSNANDLSHITEQIPNNQ
jgi:hypothetical protein